MPLKQKGQNTLLVPTIRWFEGAYTVDLHFSISGGNRNLKRLLKQVIHVNSNEYEFWNETWSTYFHILWSVFETKIDLGIEEELSSLDRAYIRSFMLHLKSNERWQPCQIYKNSSFSMSPHDYYGLKTHFKFPTIRQKRRDAKVHVEQYIGVGYKDKGAAKVVSEDGTPHWKAVTSYENEKSQEATLLRQNITSKVKEFDTTVILLRKRKSIFDSQRKALFQKVQHSEEIIGYKLKVPPVFKFIGFVSELDDLERIQSLNSLKTRITDGEYFFF